MSRPTRIRNRRVSRAVELQNRHLTASRVTLDLHGARITGVFFRGEVLIVSAGDGGEGGNARGGNGVAGEVVGETAAVGLAGSVDAGAVDAVGFFEVGD